MPLMISVLMFGVPATAEPMRKSEAGTLLACSARRVATEWALSPLSSKVSAICLLPLGPL